MKSQGEQPPSEASLKRMFAYWESGERAVTVAAYQRAFAEIYETSLSELGFDPPKPATEDAFTASDPAGAAQPRSSRRDAELPDPAASRGLRGRLLDIGRWSLWTLPRSLRLYVVTVVTLWVCMATVASAHLTLRSEDLMVLGVLLGCAAVSIESGRSLGEAADRVWRDMLGIWTLPLMLMLPPAYALMAPVPLQLLSQWRVHRTLPHRVAFSISAVGLASGLGSLVFHRMTGSATELSQWLLLGLFAAALRTSINVVLVAAAVKASHPEERWPHLLFSREGAILEALQISVGLAVAALSLSSIWLAPLMLPAGLFLSNRAAMTLQFTALAHTDAETEVLTAGGWEREAEVAIARAQRKQTPVAVLLIDLGQSDRVAGHLITDAELRAFVDAMRSELKPGNIVGRVGDAQFVVLLTDIRPTDIHLVAERLRALAETAVPSAVGRPGEVVSIGAASLSKPRIEVADLVGAASTALHRSKASNDNRIVHLGFGVDGDNRTEP